MTARDLLAALRRAGLVVRYDHDGNDGKGSFEVTPPGKLTAEDIEAIRSVRHELRELLIAEHLEGLDEQLYDWRGEL